MTILWQQPKNFPMLATNEMHVWAANLNLNAEQLKQYQVILSLEEQERAARFKFDIHRNRFIAAKGILRKLLGLYLNIEPENIEFILGAHGKPYLPKELLQNLFFNVSDSQDLALYAFALNNEMGIDVEFIRDNVDALAIAERFFSAHEKQQLAQLPKAQQELGFFSCWTRKEAVIKALGAGLSFHLDKFDVSLAPTEPVKLINIEGDKAEKWSLYNLEPASNYVAALAIKTKTETTLRCFRFVEAD